jgi:hypothetical protein
VISFGDNVRIVDNELTRRLGVAGLVGQIYGETTPSITGVSVIGEATSDHAVNVHFDGRSDTMWFAPNLVVFVDHAPGTEIGIDGAGETLVRQADGSWVKRETARHTPRPWWKFW